MINTPCTDDPDNRPVTPMPARIAAIFLLVQSLAAYGRHISGLINHPATWRGFVTVARFFGTVDVPEIAARIQRGLMRAIALEAMLRQRAQRGRDLVILAPAASGARKDPPAAPPPRQAPEPRARPLWQPPLTLETLPTQQEIEAEIRRRPIGRTIAAICLDLGISPTLCDGPFWNRLFDAMQDYRGSLVAVMSEFRRREETFEREDWKRQSLPWPERTREGVRQVLGFFIGQDQFRPVPTGPP